MSSTIDPDPRSHLESSLDFYALLSLPPTFTDAALLARAKRTGALKYHPDRATRPDASDAEKEAAREKWNLFEVGLKLLGDESLRAQYDGYRAAREQKKARDQKRDAERQGMLDRLERREGGARREREEEDGKERELRRLREMGRRAREELGAKRRKMARQMEVQREKERKEEVETRGSRDDIRSQRQGGKGSFLPTSDPDEFQRRMEATWRRIDQMPGMTKTVERDEARRGHPVCKSFPGLPSST